MPVEVGPKTMTMYKFAEAIAAVTTRLGRRFTRNDLYYLIYNGHVEDDFARVGPFRLFTGADLDRIVEAAGKVRPYRRRKQN